MKWVHQKIINKASRLPWLEVYPEKNTVKRKSEFDTFLSEPLQRPPLHTEEQPEKHREKKLEEPSENGEIHTQLKYSLDEVLSLYDQTIGYDKNEVENHVDVNESERDEIRQMAGAFAPVSRIEPAGEVKPQTNLQKNLVNFHYAAFHGNDFNNPLKPSLNIQKYSFPQSPVHPFISQTGIQSNESTPESSKNYASNHRQHAPLMQNNVESKTILHKELQNITVIEDSSIDEDEDLQPREHVSTNVPESGDHAELSEHDTENNFEENHDLDNESNSDKNEEELFDIAISRQNIFPVNEEFLMNPLTAQSYSTERFDEFDENEIRDEQNDFEFGDNDNELKRAELESYEPDDEKTDELYDALESGNVSFRCSVTPEIKTNGQFIIPFNILRTGTDEYDHSDPVEVQQIIEKLELTLDQFGIEARVIGMQRGPIITRYEMRIPPGIKVNRILSLTDELAMALEALRVRIEAPIPGRSTVGIEIPNKKRSTVLLGDILNHPDYNANAFKLPLPLGKDIAGNLLIEDLCRMPHILIAGATGSGKSVAINAFITSLIITKSPEEVRMLMVDPKLVELSQYNDIPHLLHPVICDAQKAILALNWAVEEMDRRYEDMADMRARDITSYNLKVEHHNKIKKSHEEYIPKMPYIVILIDELGDLMMVAGKEVESSIIRLSQKARAIGIHLILATQRPSVDVITALIKANCPARIALQVAQKTDSRTILDSNGGEQLLGQGDMLFKHPSKAQLIRAQAPYVSDVEVENVVNMVKKTGKPSYIVLEDPKARTGELETEDENLFDEAWTIIVESKKASASYLQRRLRIGYNRAARIIEAFEARGYIGPQVGSKPREIFIHNN